MALKIRTDDPSRGWIGRPPPHPTGCSCGPCRARAIREAAAAGVSPTELAERYQRALSTICRILDGEVYADAGGPIRTARRRKEPRVNRTVAVPRDLAERIDQARGDAPFGPWMLEAAEARLAARSRAL